MILIAVLVWFTNMTTACTLMTWITIGLYVDLGLKPQFANPKGPTSVSERVSRLRVLKISSPFGGTSNRTLPGSLQSQLFSPSSFRTINFFSPEVTLTDLAVAHICSLLAASPFPT